MMRKQCRHTKCNTHVTTYTKHHRLESGERRLVDCGYSVWVACTECLWYSHAIDLPFTQPPIAPWDADKFERMVAEAHARVAGEYAGRFEVKPWQNGVHCAIELRLWLFGKEKIT